MLQTLDNGSHAVTCWILWWDVLFHHWAVTLLKESFFTCQVVFLIYSLFLVSADKVFPFFLCHFFKNLFTNTNVYDIIGVLVMNWLANSKKF